MENEKKERLPIEVRFGKFNEKNPTVFEQFESIVGGLIKGGKKRISVSAITEYMRCKDLFTKEENPQKIRINNDFRSRMVRKYVMKHPEHLSYFRMRNTRTP